MDWSVTKAHTEWFWDIFFPTHCLGCRETLQYSKREVFCPVCHLQVFISDTHLVDNHPLKNRLCVGFPFKLVLSKYRYPNQSTVISNMIHGLKYQNLRYIGHLEGAHYGQIISPLLQKHEVSALIPVPLHWRKKLKRGYNQSYEYAVGLSQTTGLPINTNIIRRVKFTKSQTQLNKSERVKNMKNAFRATRTPNAYQATNQPHFLLVDDVSTSGITLVEMAHTLRRAYPDADISVCTLAYKDY